MKRFITIVLLLIISKANYSQRIDNWAYPYLKVHSKNVKPPNSFEDALNQLDIVLKDEIINHFKKDEELIATIEISQELEDFFANFWKMSFLIFGGKPSDSKVYHSSVLVNKCSAFGLTNPDLIMRVVFRCYHKKLNNKKYSLYEEINKIINEYGTYECNAETVEQIRNAELKIKSHEDSIIFINELNRYNLNDTLGRRYYEKERKSEFFVSGTIKEIDKTRNIISLCVFDIVSDKRYRVMHYNNHLLRIGDTINVEYNYWNKFNESYFYYRDGTYRFYSPRWNEYIKNKFNGN